MAVKGLVSSVVCPFIGVNFCLRALIQPTSTLAMQAGLCLLWAGCKGYGEGLCGSW